MNTPRLPTRVLPLALHFIRQFRWGCLGLLVFPIVGRAVFASICVAALSAIVIYFTVSMLVGRECTRRAVASNEARASVTGRVVDALTNIRNVFFFANQALCAGRVLLPCSA